MNQGSEDLMAIIEPSTDHMPGPADIAVPALGQVPSEYVYLIAWDGKNITSGI